MKRICLYGASSASLAQEYYAAAHIVGQGLAACGIGLVFGGGATGLMGCHCWQACLFPKPRQER